MDGQLRVQLGQEKGGEDRWIWGSPWACNAIGHVENTVALRRPGREVSRVHREALGDTVPFGLTSLCFRELLHLPWPGVSREAVGMVGRVYHSRILLNMPRGVTWWPKWGRVPEMPLHLCGMCLKH